MNYVNQKDTFRILSENVLQRVAASLKKPAEEVAQATTATARAFFRIA